MAYTWKHTDRLGTGGVYKEMSTPPPEIRYAIWMIVICCVDDEGLPIYAHHTPAGRMSCWVFPICCILEILYYVNTTANCKPASNCDFSLAVCMLCSFSVCLTYIIDGMVFFLCMVAARWSFVLYDVLSLHGSHYSQENVWTHNWNAFISVVERCRCAA